MIFDILERKLELAYLLVPGETLFRNYMPPEVSIGAMTKVPLDGMPIDPYIRDYYRGNFQVVTRHVDPVEGDALANGIMRVLTVRTPEDHEASEERGRARITLFQPQTLPIRFPRLEGNGYEWLQVFDANFTFEPL